MSVPMTTLLRRLWRFVAPHWPLILLAAILIAASATVEVLVPYALKVAIDAHIAVHHVEGLAFIVALIGLGFLGRSVIRMGVGYTLMLLGQRTSHDLRTAVHDHLLSRSATFFDRNQVGRLMSTINGDVDSVNEMFANGIVTFIADIVTLVAIVGTMLYLSVELTLVTLVLFPLLQPVFKWSRTLMRRSFTTVNEKRASLSAYIIERISGLKTVQAFNRERITVTECEAISDRFRAAAVDSLRAGAIVSPITDAAAIVAGAIVLLYLGIAREAATAGLVFAFIEYANRFYGPIAALAQKSVFMQSGFVGCERVFALLDSGEPDAPRRDAPPPPVNEPVAHALQFRDVQFGYRPNEPVLRGVTLDVPPGQSIAVVGATGAGKSTLVRLLARHYDAQAGEVRVHGRDVRDWSIDDLRRRLTVIQQDVFLFSGTVADNIRLGRPGATNTDVEEALVRVGGTRLLQRTGGIDAEVAERGANLSAGERQLISFARALIRDPEVLILDEATANVDPETEQTIERALAALFSGRTSLIIAHRLSTIRRADRIIVMQNGNIAEHGTRDELLAAGGVYAKLEEQLGH